MFPYVYIYIVVTVLTLIYLIAYNSNELARFFKLIIIIFLSGVGLFSSSSFLIFFIFYELLLLPSFLVLYSYAKTRKSIEASFLMFFWTQFGAIFLFFFFIHIYTITNSTSFLSFEFLTFTPLHKLLIVFLILIGFGVKFPIWPFYEWLPKAHVESSTNFSIFLSGVLVKFAFFAFFKSIYYFNSNFYIIAPCLWLYIGIFDVIFKLYYQIDLKKLIAYATTVEMHWLCLATLSGQTVLWFSIYAMLISHAFISSNFFFIVDSITRRYKTRLITEVSGLFFNLPKLYVSTIVLLVIFLGFPGSLFFVAEFLFFSYMADYSLFLIFILLILLYFIVASCYFKNWFFALFGYSINLLNVKIISDLDFKEYILFGFLSFLVFFFGLTNNLFLA